MGTRHCLAVALLPLFVLALLLAQVVAGYAEPVFPKLTGRVVDDAAMLSAEQRQQLEDKLQALEEKSTDQFVVVTLPSLQGYAIEEFGVLLGRHWQIGQKDKNNGILLIVAPKERKVRIEVGYGLEGVMTDTLAGNIVHNRILPLFRQGRMADGILTGANDIIDTLTGDAEAVAERARGGRQNDNGGDIFGLFFIFVWLAMFFGIGSSTLFPGSGKRGGVIIVPSSGSSSGWSGGSGGFGGSSGGGGFSGGGGSFGGGGSSGGW